MKWLFLRDSKTGRKTVVLNTPAAAILAELPRIGVYVIAAGNAGNEDEKPRSDLKRPWTAVRKRAGLEGVRLHDLRHTHASIGAAGGLGLPIIGKLLGHKQATTTARYAHLDNDPLRRASEAIAGRIAEAMGSDRRTTMVRWSNSKKWGRRLIGQIASPAAPERHHPDHSKQARVW